MSELEELQQRIRNLAPEDLSKFRAWFFEFDHLLWDRQLEADAENGKLVRLANEAIAEHKASKAKSKRS